MRGMIIDDGYNLNSGKYIPDSLLQWKLETITSELLASIQIYSFQQPHRPKKKKKITQTRPHFVQRFSDSYYTNCLLLLQIITHIH